MGGGNRRSGSVLTTPSTLDWAGRQKGEANTRASRISGQGRAPKNSRMKSKIRLQATAIVMGAVKPPTLVGRIVR
jgi:hypothetical protein